VADSPTTPTPRDESEEATAVVGEKASIDSDSTPSEQGVPTQPASSPDESSDEPTPGLTVPVGQGEQPRVGRYQGSAFHQSRYQGIQDAISWQDENRRRQRRRDRFRQSTITVMLVVGALLGGITGGSFAVWSLTSDGLVQAGQYSPPTISVTNPDDATPITAVAATALPSVVTLQVQGGGAGGSGSGVIISEEGHIVTNAHVVTVGGQASDPRIRVATTDGRLWMAEVIGTDPVSDIAVIKVEAPQSFVPIRVGDSSAMNVGDQTVAIGAPLGLSNTVTLGIVSALNRSITVGESAPEDGPGSFDFDLPGGQTLSAGVSIPVIQTDASINPGNSGGALLNADGELIGINVAIASNAASSQSAGSIGLGFAIPVNYALRVAEELIQTGRASHGLLGATVTDAAFDEAATISGAYIDSVVPGGPADQIGLRAGDVVTSFNQLPITNRIDLTAQVRTLPGGATAPITYVRGGQTYTTQVTLAELGAS
jgi:putative serine protease PepD